MSLQELLFITGVVSFATGGVLFALAARQYAKEDMRAVMDDLSGRRRQKGVDALAHVSGSGRSGTRSMVPMPEVQDRESIDDEETLFSAGMRSRLQVGIGAEDDSVGTVVDVVNGFFVARRIVLSESDNVVQRRS